MYTLVLHRLSYDQRSVREYRVANSEHCANARTDWLKETESIREIRYDLGILSDGFRPEYSRRYVHLPGWGISMEWKSAGAHFQQQLAGVLSGLLYKECELYMTFYHSQIAKRRCCNAYIASLRDSASTMSP
jgi:hypothetical protein